MSDFDMGFVIFPGMTQLDLTGPYEVLSRLGTPASLDEPTRFAGARTHVIAATMEPVLSDRGLGILPTATFRTAPRLDLICVPGGGGVLTALENEQLVNYVAAQGAQAAYVTSVCMGAFLLGAAGLLEGRRAATHWAFADLLPLVGAVPAAGRVVQDGNIITSGGVTSGIDFGFAILAELAGADVARAVQLGIEYDPAPPFDCGIPEKSSDAAVALMRHRNSGTHEGLRARLADLAKDRVVRG